MMRRIRVLIQAGHSSAFVPHQQGGGGAPGEAAWVSDLAQRLAARLTTRGVDVVLVGCWNLDNSNAPAAVTDQDYDLFLSLHYDAAIYPGNTGCFADRAANDPVGPESDRFIAIWERIYPQATGLALHNERRNSNTFGYYAFRATTARTPGVVIEHCVGPEVALDVAADADAAAVLEYLGDTTMSDADKAILDVMHGLGADASSIDGWIKRLAVQDDQIAALRQELAATQEQLAQVPPPAPPVSVEGASLAVRVELSDGRTVEVPLAKGVPG